MSGLAEQIIGAVFSALLFLLILKVVEKERMSMKQAAIRFITLSSAIFVIFLFANTV